MARKLTKGEKYDTSRIDFAEWNSGEKYRDGCNCWDYFDPDGTYRGPDEAGLEPLFVDQE